MNVLLVNYEYPPVGGGAATATQAIARALVTLGHTPHVLTSAFQNLQGTTQEEGVHVHRIPARRTRAEACSLLEMASFVASAAPRISRLVRRQRIDGCIAFFSFPCGPLALLAGCPYIVSLRGGDVPGTEASLDRFHRVLRPLRRFVLRRARSVVANSPGLAALSQKADPVPVQVIPNGVDTDFFYPPAHRAPGPRPFRWLFIGRFQPQKNLAWLLRQMAVVHAANPGYFVLDLVGDGPLRTELQALAQELGLADVVSWHGWQPRDRLRDIYHRADALINPSLYEGMPNVVLEAMACGLPVLASNVAGNDAVVIDGETGGLFDLENSPELLGTMAEWMQSSTRIAALGRAARARAVSSFSWTQTTTGYLQYLIARSAFPA